MRVRFILLASIAIALAAPVPFAHAASVPGRLAVFGDTGTSATTQANVNGALADGASAYLGLGDYEYTASVSQWSSIVQPLTSLGAYMARGNHDDATALAAYFPQGTIWSRSFNGARIVALDTEQRVDVGVFDQDEISKRTRVGDDNHAGGRLARWIREVREAASRAAERRLRSANR